MAEDGVILDVSGIRFSYNSRPVLAQVGFSLGPGRVLAVLGKNGAGKSTLLKCLNRILHPQSGDILLEGENLSTLSRRETARRVGYVPQRHGTDRLTVYETVLLGRKPHMGLTVSADDFRRVEDILEHMGLTRLSTRPVSDLSGGEAQKVMIARALAQSPRALLLDEPTSNLDLRNQLEVMDLIRAIALNQGLSVVVSIHDLNLAVRFADAFLFLKDHRVHAMVEKEDLTADIIREVYGVAVSLRQLDGRTVVIPL
ncbi:MULTISPECIES: ABC transporter ATP-binding protein [Desulfococcus]|jgi:iron complex transport system ATP-binding protein|uniref:ABC transporter related protein n=1 Tax=Desulfococcus multivorans DSM 2059 TaxID=1121405 RepID=S7TRX2_DESML|nr:ABC transporter ATP-binding protein [Desulfococcus multivorans]AOY57146.1 HmuV1: hemin transport system, ATP-binding protein [Desulfococcus multivorans]AQV02830.2 iron ABC transporter ATP-binding protein [Desulfococcus multivorans]EPR39902.1 ABC transporter related protein [Desulfococcus multivorans DSM 2059]MDX9819341.1 ABC transporter ATP-binding protein [Desulfococcus multivorans]SKA22950.1 iron complex transport system ATP-binding protein [Desulfococcus multivorans DSM 2059]